MNLDIEGNLDKKSGLETIGKPALTSPTAGPSGIKLDPLTTALGEEAGHTAQEGQNEPQIFLNLYIVVDSWIFTTLSIMAIICGSVFFDDCTIDPRIPIMLIIWGSFQLGSNLLTLLITPFVKNSGNLGVMFGIVIDALTGLTALGACIGMMVIVFIDYSTVNLVDPKNDNYCQPLMYWFGFWISILGLAGTVLKCMFVWLWLVFYKPKTLRRVVRRFGTWIS